MRNKLTFTYVTKEDSTFEAFKNLLPPGSDLEGSLIHLGCALDGAACGVISYVETFTECELKWIYVYEDLRRQGIATALVEELIDNHLDIYGLKDIFFQVHTLNQPDTAIAYPQEDFSDNPSLELFCENCVYFDPESSAPRYVISPERLKESTALNKLAGSITENVAQRLYDMPRGFILDTFSFLEREQGFVVNDFKDWNETIEKDLSLVILDDKKRIAGLCIYHKYSDLQLEISFLYSSSPVALRRVLAESFILLTEKYPQASLIMIPQNETGDNLVYGLFGITDAEYSVTEYHWNFTHPMYIDPDLEGGR